jgi:hypothetical protein
VAWLLGDGKVIMKIAGFVSLNRLTI